VNDGRSLAVRSWISFPRHMVLNLLVHCELRARSNRSEDAIPLRKGFFLARRHVLPQEWFLTSLPGPLAFLRDAGSASSISGLVLESFCTPST